MHDFVEEPLHTDRFETLADGWRAWRAAAGMYGGLAPQALPSDPPADPGAALAAVAAANATEYAWTPIIASAAVEPDAIRVRLSYGGGRSAAYLILVYPHSFAVSSAPAAWVGARARGEALANASAEGLADIARSVSSRWAAILAALNPREPAPPPPERW